MTLQKEKGDGLSDNRVVRVISTASDATSVTSVQRTVKTGEKISVPCHRASRTIITSWGVSTEGISSEGTTDALQKSISFICTFTSS